MREEDAYQVDRGQSDSNMDEDGDVIMEGAQDSGPTGAEPQALPYPWLALKKPSTLWR